MYACICSFTSTIFLIHTWGDVSQDIVVSRIYVSVCTYLCMYVLCCFIRGFEVAQTNTSCMRVCFCLCMFVCMIVRMYVYVHAHLYVCMYVCMYVCTYVCIFYVCMYAYIHTNVCMYAYIDSSRSITLLIH